VLRLDGERHPGILTSRSSASRTLREAGHRPATVVSSPNASPAAARRPSRLRHSALQRRLGERPILAQHSGCVRSGDLNRMVIRDEYLDGVPWFPLLPRDPP